MDACIHDIKHKMLSSAERATVSNQLHLRDVFPLILQMIRLERFVVFLPFFIKCIYLHFFNVSHF